LARAASVGGSINQSSAAAVRRPFQRRIWCSLK
jgi:hypothetical protein